MLKKNINKENGGRKFAHIAAFIIISFVMLKQGIAQVYTYLNTAETTTSIHAIATCVTHAMNDQHKAWSQVRITSPSGRVVTVNTGNPNNATYWPYVTATATADLPLLSEDGDYSVVLTAEQYCYIAKVISQIPGKDDTPTIVPFCTLVSLKFNPVHVKKSLGSSTLVAKVTVSNHYIGPFELLGTEADHSNLTPPYDYTFQGLNQELTQTPGATLEYSVGFLTTAEGNTKTGTVTGFAVLQGYSGTQTKVGTLLTNPNGTPSTGANVDLN